MPKEADEYLILAVETTHCTSRRRSRRMSLREYAWSWSCLIAHVWVCAWACPGRVLMPCSMALALTSTPFVSLKFLSPPFCYLHAPIGIRASSIRMSPPSPPVLCLHPSSLLLTLPLLPSPHPALGPPPSGRHHLLPLWHGRHRGAHLRVAALPRTLLCLRHCWQHRLVRAHARGLTGGVGEFRVVLAWVLEPSPDGCCSALRNAVVGGKD